MKRHHASGTHISAHTKLTAVVGTPLRHSMSPVIHNAIYRDFGIDAILLAFESKSIEEIMTAMRTLPIHMGAFTIPMKQVVMPYLDTITEEAREIGSVNTVINKDGKLHGHNTDIVGIRASLPAKAMKGKKVLLIGAGGVAQPIAYHLGKSGAKIYCTNRELSMAEATCKRFGGTVIAKDALASVPFDVIINATPVGAAPFLDQMAIPEELIHRGSIVFDVIYAPAETKLIKVAKKRGAKGVSGVKMFVAQAIEQERLWLGRKIPDNGYTKLVEKALAKMATRS